MGKNGPLINKSYIIFMRSNSPPLSSPELALFDEFDFCPQSRKCRFQGENNVSTALTTTVRERILEFSCSRKPLARVFLERCRFWKWP